MAEVKYAFLADGCDIWRDVAVNLDVRFGATPSLWLGHPRHIDFASERFPQCAVLDERELNIGVFERTGMAPIPHSVRESSAFLRFEIAALYSLQRNEIHRDVGFLDRRTYISSLSDFLWGRLVASEATHVIAAQAPHTAAGLLLVGMFEALGIEMLHFDQVSVGPFMVPRIGLRYGEVAVPNGTASKDASSFEDEVRQWITLFRSQVSGRRFAPSEERKSGFESDLSGPLGIARRLRFARQEITVGHVADGSEIAPSGALANRGKIIGAAQSVRRRSKAIRALRSAYDRHASPLGDQRDFALFLLHYEPEKTTVPDGGLNGDQLAAVRTAASTLPAGMSLLVKEHPSQLMYVAHGHTGRTPGFYRELSTIDNVTLVDRRASNWDLIDRAKMVFTVTGTVGLEATFVATPVVYFGFPWYAGLEGTFALGDIRSAKANVTQALESPASAGDTTVENLVSLIARSSIPGVISPGRERYFQRLGWEPGSTVEPPTILAATHLGLI